MALDSLVHEHHALQSLCITINQILGHSDIIVCGNEQYTVELELNLELSFEEPCVCVIEALRCSVSVCSNELLTCGNMQTFRANAAQLL